MRLVARPKLKTKLKTKALKETAKLLRLTAGNKEAFTGRPVTHALPSLSCRCKINLLISGANEKKKIYIYKKQVIQQENHTKTGLGVGWQSQSCAPGSSHGEKQSPCSSSSPCLKDAHFYFSLWSNTRTLMTQVNCLWKSTSTSLLLLPRWVERRRGPAGRSSAARHTLRGVGRSCAVDIGQQDVTSAT